MSDTLPPPLPGPADAEPVWIDAPPAPAQVVLDTAPGNATRALHAAAIGPVGTARYLALFTEMEATQRPVGSWNWAASLCTFGWMLFRRMGTAALLYLAAAVTLLLGAGVLALLLLHDAPLLQAGVALLAGAVLWGVPGLWGDRWLYAHARGRIERALAASPDWNEAAVLLARDSVTWPRAGWIALGHAVLAALLAGAWLALGPTLAPATEAAPTRGVAVAAPPAPPVSAAPVQASAATLPAASAAPLASSAPLVPASAAPQAQATPAPAPASAPVGAPSSAAASASTAVAAPAVVRAPVQPPAAAGPAIRPPATASATRPAPRAQAPSTASAARPPGRVLVNVGLFAVESNARAAHARLRAAGLPATMELLQTRNGPRTRVRAGPFASRAAAEAAAVRIRALGLEAQLVPPPPGGAG